VNGQGNLGVDALSAILSRTSVRRFRTEALDPELITRVLDCAVRAPNHKLTEPWRFVVLSGAARDRFAEIRAQHRLKRFVDPSAAEAQTAAEKVRREAREVPAYIVVSMILNSDDLTREEDYAATMMAIQNLIVAAQALGLGTYLRTGGVMAEPKLRQLAEIPSDQRVVGIVSLGFPAEAESPRRRKPAAELTRWIER
jgi:nitroreductase